VWPSQWPSLEGLSETLWRLNLRLNKWMIFGLLLACLLHLVHSNVEKKICPFNWVNLSALIKLSRISGGLRCTCSLVCALGNLAYSNTYSSMEKPSANDGYLPEGQNFRQHCIKYFKYSHHNFMIHFWMLQLPVLLGHQKWISCEFVTESETFKTGIAIALILLLKNKPSLLNEVSRLFLHLFWRI